MSPRGPLLAIGLFASLAGCPQTIRIETCDKSSCQGCCDGNGHCHLGTEASYCGSGAQACSVCVAGEYVCNGSGCVPVGSGDAGRDGGLGPPDGSPSADGSVDASAPDASARDSGGIGPDAGPLDAGGIDSGTSIDAGACGGAACGSTVATGGVFTCALNSGGSLRCWGTNANGELGDNSTADSLVPVSVSNASNSVVAVSTGDWHACAIQVGGGLLCWGMNTWGQVGDGSTTDDLVPTSVVRLAVGVITVAAGSVHTCAVTPSAAAYCWGSNLFGQIGDGSGADQHLPALVSGLSSGVASITASGHHSCALLSSGGVRCWGQNAYGELGNGTTNDSPTPVGVTNLSTGALAVSAGNSDTCAIVGIGVECWGANDLGQVGNGATSTTPQTTPGPVTALGGSVASLAVGGSHACVLLSGGSVQCWGSNLHGQIGDGTSGNHRTSATNVTGLPANALEIAAGSSATCARIADGTVWCWGYNGYGQLGDNSNSDSAVPVLVSTL